MKICLLLLFCLVCGTCSSSFDTSDNEFAEFEEFDEDDSQVTVEDETVEEVQVAVEVEKIADDEVDSEFDHFHDKDEFEGFDEVKRDEKHVFEPSITITNVPIHFRTNWDSYWLEILMIAGLFVYLCNFLMGKSKNNKIANLWFQTHKALLEDNFSLVGDDPYATERQENVGLVKESESNFNLWCSGRTCCEGMLVELRLIKRQDLVAILSGLIRPTLDQFHVRVIMNKEDMDGFVFAVATKKTAVRLSKEMNDISVFCPERRSGEKHGIPSTFNVMGEIAEATAAMLDSKVVAMLNKYSDLIDYIHFSDQYTGPKQTEEGTTPSLKLPETEKLLLFGFNVPFKGRSLEATMEYIKPLMIMVFYCIEKVRRYRLSREGKTKSEKNRHRVEEVFLKSTHAARAEAAAARKEEKRRLEKERVMADDDPERQRRWEEKENKRQAKKRQPKMKQLKVKAM